MNKDIIKNISEELDIKEKQAEVVLTLLSEGNTIPFIARYRKEATGALDEEIIRKINEVYEYENNLLKRKEDVIRLIDEKGMLTDEIKMKVLNCKKLVEVEDIYRPYKDKKKTKAGDAIKLGLEPLAKMIMSFPTKGNIDSLCSKFINENVKDTEFAVLQASYIISEYISDNPKYRDYIRKNIKRNGVFISKLKKNGEEKDPNKTYEMYYDYQEKANYIKPHRVMAMNRGEKEGILTVKLDYDIDYIVNYLETNVIKNKDSFVVDIVKDAIKDSLKRLILPSVEREVRSEINLVAEDNAIDNFSNNLESLLLTPPIKGKKVLGYDPAFRTGCKLACLDETGKVLDISVIYPTEPHLKIEESKKKVLELIDKYDIDIIAIGNGTASRESEMFIADTIKESKKKVEYVIVNEAGASVYSASKLAIEEFPDLTVEKRSAISIGRRLQDSLSELVKIDPKSIGVGQYQHDVNEKKLDESLDFVVTKAVNSVGVNINNASTSLLKYVSGMTKKAIESLIEYRNNYGKITTREEIKKIKGITPKVYEQAIGFMRIIDGKNPLDKTGIHPESYKLTEQLLKDLDLTVNDIGTDKLKDKLNNLDKDKITYIDKYTLDDIIKDLVSPLRDPRETLKKPLLKSDILKIEDLHIGDTLQGTVRNVIDFGAFIDVGLHNDGLVHISKISKNYIKHPSEVLSVGDIIDVKVIDINKDKEKISLSMVD